MKIEIEIDDKELEEAVKEKIVDTLTKEILTERHTSERRIYKLALRDTIDELCRKTRDEMQDAVVEKVADKIARKAIKDGTLKNLGTMTINL